MTFQHIIKFVLEAPAARWSSNTPSSHLYPADQANLFFNPKAACAHVKKITKKHQKLKEHGIVGKFEYTPASNMYVQYFGYRQPEPLIL